MSLSLVWVVAAQLILLSLALHGRGFAQGASWPEQLDPGALLALGDDYGYVTDSIPTVRLETRTSTGSLTEHWAAVGGQILSQYSFTAAARLYPDDSRASEGLAQALSDFQRNFQRELQSLEPIASAELLGDEAWGLQVPDSHAGEVAWRRGNLVLTLFVGAAGEKGQDLIPVPDGAILTFAAALDGRAQALGSEPPVFTWGEQRGILPWEALLTAAEMGPGFTPRETKRSLGTCAPLDQCGSGVSLGASVLFDGPGGPFYVSARTYESAEAVFGQPTAPLTASMIRGRCCPLRDGQTWDSLHFWRGACVGEVSIPLPKPPNALTVEAISNALLGPAVKLDAKLARAGC